MSGFAAPSTRLPRSASPAVHKWTRRAVIGAGGLIGGGLALGVGGIVFAPNRLRYVPDSTGEAPYLTTWIKITPDNEVIAVVPHCEMGQGARTGVAMMLAEELEADWSRVRIEEAPPEPLFANGYVMRGFAAEAGFDVPPWLVRALDYATYKTAAIASMQITGGSSSTRATGQYGMRVAGAAAREMLLAAAARRFGVSVDELVARESMVSHESSGRRASYGELASAAAEIRPPSRPALKRRDEYRLVGTPQKRADIPHLVTGTTRFGVDVAVPDMLYAAISAAPMLDAKLVSVDASRAKSLPGVREVVELSDAVAVVADGYWQAEQALRALEPLFGDSALSHIDSNDIFAAHAEALDGVPAARERARELSRVDAEYRVPYLAHVTMEPMAATAELRDGRCEVWAGTQDPLGARAVAARAAGLDVADVTFHNLPLGGGFGRRLPGNFDYIAQAVRIARAVSPRPVKLIWSREEDMQHDYYRPAVLARMSSELDADGRPLDWRHVFTGQGFLDKLAATPIYAVGATEIRSVDAPVYLRTGSWRSVASSQHGFFMESFVDELAHAAGADPVAYRASLLGSQARHRRVLEHVARMADWSSPPPTGRARGVAIVESFGSIVGQVAEVGIDANERLRVHRMHAAVDCGLVVNPNQATAQVEGAIVFGLSAALYQAITVERGRVVQRNFPDYDMVRLADVPRISVEFLESDAPMGGLGEPGVPPVAPAVANAVFALTGRRLRELPLRLA
jgi:isoquinoline 1-oxidoreductase beta subunit